MGQRGMAESCTSGIAIRGSDFSCLAFPATSVNSTRQVDWSCPVAIVLGSFRCQMAVKKDANQLIDDLLAGQFATLLSPSGGGQIEESLRAILSEDYDFSEEQLRQALLGKRDQIEDFIGVPLTEEQLQAIDGGKGLSTDAKYGIGFGGAVGGIAGGFFAALVIGELVVLK